MGLFGAAGRRFARRSRWLAERLWVVAAIEIGWVANRHWRRLDKDERRRARELLVKSRASPCSASSTTRSSGEGRPGFCCRSDPPDGPSSWPLSDLSGGPDLRVSRVPVKRLLETLAQIHPRLPADLASDLVGVEVLAVDLAAR